MVVLIKHTLSKVESQIRMQKMIEHSRKQYSNFITDYNETWNQNIGNINFLVNSVSITSTIEVKELEIIIKIKLPFIVTIFKSKIQSEIGDVANKYF
jgi:Putative polyhydroxyalkanoic acid system protein (PHA_gran_rgn)